MIALVELVIDQPALDQDAGMAIDVHINPVWRVAVVVDQVVVISRPQVRRVLPGRLPKSLVILQRLAGRERRHVGEACHPLELGICLVLDVGRVGRLDAIADRRLPRIAADPVFEHLFDGPSDFDGLVNPVAGELQGLELLDLLRAITRSEQDLDLGASVRVLEAVFVCLDLVMSPGKPIENGPLRRVPQLGECVPDDRPAGFLDVVLSQQLPGEIITELPAGGGGLAAAHRSD